MGFPIRFAAGARLDPSAPTAITVREATIFMAAPAGGKRHLRISALLGFPEIGVCLDKVVIPSGVEGSTHFVTLLG